MSEEEQRIVSVTGDELAATDMHESLRPVVGQITYPEEIGAQTTDAMRHLPSLQRWAETDLPRVFKHGFHPIKGLWTIFLIWQLRTLTSNCYKVTTPNHEDETQEQKQSDAKKMANNLKRTAYFIVKASGHSYSSITADTIKDHANPYLKIFECFEALYTLLLDFADIHEVPYNSFHKIEDARTVHIDRALADFVARSSLDDILVKCTKMLADQEKAGTLLKFAIDADRVDAISPLIERLGPQDLYVISALVRSFKNENLEIATKLMAEYSLSNFKITSNSESLIFLAIDNNWSDIAIKLLENMPLEELLAPLNYTNCGHPLNYALDSDNYEIAQAIANKVPACYRADCLKEAMTHSMARRGEDVIEATDKIVATVLAQATKVELYRLYDLFWNKNYTSERHIEINQRRINQLESALRVKDPNFTAYVEAEEPKKSNSRS